MTTTDLAKTRGGEDKPPKPAKNWSEILRWFLTFIILGVVIWWLWIVSGVQGTAATIDATTKLTLDPYARSKETLAIVLPFLTLVLGYWFGVKAVDGAQQNAKAATETAAAATETAKAATDKADVATSRLEVLASVVPAEAYKKAVSDYPHLFGKK